MKICADEIDAMQLPIEAEAESLLACETLETVGQLIGFLTAICIFITNIEEHTVGTCLISLINSLLQGIGRQPVVSIEKTSKTSSGMFQSHISSMGLPLVMI